MATGWPLNQPGGVLDTARQAAISRGHDVISGYDRNVDVIRTYCFECGAQIVVLLDRFGCEESIYYDETEGGCL